MAELNKNSRSSTMPQISHKVMNAILFPIPPIAEQKRIVEKVDSLKNLLILLKKKQKSEIKQEKN